MWIWPHEIIIIKYNYKNNGSLGFESQVVSSPAPKSTQVFILSF